MQKWKASNVSLRHQPSTVQGSTVKKSGCRGSTKKSISHWNKELQKCCIDTKHRSVAAPLHRMNRRFRPQAHNSIMPRKKANIVASRDRRDEGSQDAVVAWTTCRCLLAFRQHAKVGRGMRRLSPHRAKRRWARNQSYVLCIHKIYQFTKQARELKLQFISLFKSWRTLSSFGSGR